MGVLRVEISIGDIERMRWREMSAVVDTSRPISFVPGSVLRDLGISIAMTRTIRLPDGMIRNINLGYVWLRLNDREAMTHFAFADDNTPSLLGRIAVNSLLLEIDEVSHRLVPMTNLLL